ncbi:cobalt-precorrin-6A reductase [Kribbella sp. NPDC048928]|uniref:cobalt-precorrin-6A reductase n=1 Tax=Kribbella sp. NPDC048928 TaxID=3364111 RepID=UPI003712CAE8
MRILLLGGTGEARELARRLVAEGVQVISSLAGRTTTAHQPDGEVRVGGFGGAEGLTRWLRTNPVDAVVDATHPFAHRITTNAARAAAAPGADGSGVPFLVLRRPGWSPAPGDSWHWVDTASAAADLLPGLGSRAFLTIGRQGLDTFATSGVWTLARCIEPPTPVPTWCTLLLARGPFTPADELALMRHHRIDVLVTKDSGGPATAAKLTAARELSIPVVVIRRPPLPADVQTIESVDEAVYWVMRVSHSAST